MTKLLFDAPLNKKLTESEAVIAALIVEKHRIVVARAKAAAVRRAALRGLFWL